MITELARHCYNCQTIFWIRPHILKRGYGKFCSLQCSQLFRRISHRLKFRNQDIHRKEYQKKYGLEYRQKLRQGTLNALGGKCVRCGFSDVRALQIDHVNGGGRRDWEREHNGAAYLNKVLHDTTGQFQLLCANCNWIKRVENGEDR